jgi:hypothetical protein
MEKQTSMYYVAALKKKFSYNQELKEASVGIYFSGCYHYTSAGIVVVLESPVS